MSTDPHKKVAILTFLYSGKNTNDIYMYIGEWILLGQKRMDLECVVRRILVAWILVTILVMSVEGTVSEHTRTERQVPRKDSSSSSSSDDDDDESALVIQPASVVMFDLQVFLNDYLDKFEKIDGLVEAAEAIVAKSQVIIDELAVTTTRRREEQEALDRERRVIEPTLGDKIENIYQGLASLGNQFECLADSVMVRDGDMESSGEFTLGEVVYKIAVSTNLERSYDLHGRMGTTMATRYEH